MTGSEAGFAECVWFAGGNKCVGGGGERDDPSMLSRRGLRMGCFESGEVAEQADARPALSCSPPLSPTLFTSMGLLGRLPLPPAVVQAIEAAQLTNPLNVVLLLLALYLLASLVPSSAFIPSPTSLPTSPVEYNWRPAAHAETIVWRTWRPEELRGYDGTRHDGEEKGRIMFAIRRKVYDVTTGRSFYGSGQSPRSRPAFPHLASPPLTECSAGGPYAIFAGRDASRGLAKQSFEPEMLTPLDEPIDDLKDLSTAEWDNLRDWECPSSLLLFRASHLR